MILGKRKNLVLTRQLIHGTGHVSEMPEQFLVPRVKDHRMSGSVFMLPVMILEESVSQKLLVLLILQGNDVGKTCQDMMCAVIKGEQRLIPLTVQ